MDVQTAIATAKHHIAEIFGPEGATNVGLEEVEFEDAERAWDVTIGFLRPWDQPRANALFPVAEKRTYKRVRIDDATGRVLAVKNRPTAAD